MTYKMERLTEDGFIFNDDLRRYNSIQQLMSAYSDPEGPIYLAECLPPSEYDKSPLLLCQTDNLSGDALTDSLAIESMIASPLCINNKDLQVYKDEGVPGNLTDVSICKLSHLGLDYTGRIGNTESGIRCQSWSTTNPVHKVDPKYTDSTFSDFSIKLAKNYCRNPSRDPTGPWCYTMATDNIYETCGIPLCIFTECRISGPGMEYAGKHKLTISGRKCLKWNKNRKKIRLNNVLTSRDKFLKSLFPDESLSATKKACRNPDGDIGGPWCYVEIENTSEVEKEYCDVPFCHDETCIVLTKDEKLYTHYTDFSESNINFSFAIKLWDPDSYMDASARLVLSLVALPVTGSDINDLEIGLEIYISNQKSALTFGNQGDIEYENTPGILKAHQFTYFSLTWWHGIISLFKEDIKKPIFMADYKHKNNLMGHKMNAFRYYAVQGTNVLWNFPYCEISDDCMVHTTVGSTFQQFFPLRTTNVGYDIVFHIRAFHSAYIMLVPSPVLKYPNIKVMIQRSDNFTRVICTEYEKGPESVLMEITLDNLLNYWKWREFTLGLFSNELQLYVTKDSGTFTIFNIKHKVVKQLRWFSPTSENSVAQWTFYCYPPEDSNPPKPWLPECVLNSNEPNYKGTQDVTSQGLPCLPWCSNKLLPPEVKDLFDKKSNSIYEAFNYCRDPKDEQSGTYCYTIAEKTNDRIKKEYCRIRRCKSAECKLAGTGNDYIGKIHMTRSNRTCQRWLPPVHVKNLQETPEESPTTRGGLASERFRRLVAGARLSRSDLLNKVFEYNMMMENAGCVDKWRCLRSIENEQNVPSEQDRTTIGATETTNASGQENITISDNNRMLENNDSDRYIDADLNNTNLEHSAELFQLTNTSAAEKVQHQLVGNESKEELLDYPYVHDVDQKYLNYTLYADLDLDRIKDYCRNPSRNMAGSWCYTLDPEIPRDVCNIRDCDQLEECTILAYGHGGGRYVYILPKWKEYGHFGGLRFSVKQWNPDLINGIVFEITPMEGQQEMKLIIGAEYNEKIILYYGSERVKVKKMPHLIPSGKWISFWLQIRQGEVMLGLQGVPSSLFEWKHPNETDLFSPVFLSYYTTHGHPIGMFFKCDECHTEKTKTKRFAKVFPIGLWQEEKPIHTNFTLKVRGVGPLIIPLFLFPDSEDYYAIGIAQSGTLVVLYRYNQGFGRSLTIAYPRTMSIKENKWTPIEISFTESWINITSDGNKVLYYESKSPLLFYWFSVGAEDGWITWTANCEPLDIDGEPLDGGWSKWSPWVCTAPCGGGQGYRTRTCSNPTPNIFGLMCAGSHTVSGKCNDYECGDVSPDTMDLIREHLQQNAYSIVKEEGKSVLIENNHKILVNISTDSPDAYYEWTLNGIFVNPEPGRLEFIGDDIVIHKVEVSDTGVYVCMLFRVNKQRLVLHVVSLAVTTKNYRIDTRSTRKLTLNSNAVVLGYVYSILKQKWLIDNETYHDYGITTLAAVSSEVVESLNKSHTGEWKCVIEQPDLRLSWITNIVKIRVKKAPNTFTNLMEDQLTAPLFAWLKSEGKVRVALIVIVTSVCTLVVCGLAVYLRWCRLPENKRNQQKRNRRFK